MTDQLKRVQAENAQLRAKLGAPDRDRIIVLDPADPMAKAVDEHRRNVLTALVEAVLGLLPELGDRSDVLHAAANAVAARSTHGHHWTADLLRRLADESQQPTPAVIEAQAEAYPTETSWIAEVQESDDQWMYLRADCDRAVVEQRIASMQKRFPQWKDGTSVNSRIIRKTTTYIVDAAPAVTEEPTR